MTNLADKLMYLGVGRPASGLPSALFGSIGNLASEITLGKPRWRIGLWPLQSHQDPEVAMGIASILGFLLESRRDVRVYRLFAQLEGDPSDYEWTIEKSQFSVDDWQLDNLDENVAIWGEIERLDAGWTVNLEIENDLSGEEESYKFAYTASSIAELINKLPQITEDIANDLATDLINTNVIYDEAIGDEKSITELLKALFFWERDLFLFLWGKTWTDAQILDAYSSLLQCAQELKSNFPEWVVSSAVARAMHPIFTPIGDLLVSKTAEILSGFEDGLASSLIIAQAMYRLEYTQEAYDLLESCVETHSESATAWLSLAELYRTGGHIPQAVDTFQRAIEIDIANEELFVAYADLLLVLDYENWTLEEFILIDPDEKSANSLVWEAIEAYQAVLELDPDRTDVLFQQLMQLVDIGADDARLWSGFTRLVQIDQSGEQVRSFVDALYNLDDSSPAINILQNAIKTQPQRYDLHLNLAVVYLANDQIDLAKAELEKARSLTTDPVAILSIDRLLLSANDPEFETRLGDISVLVNAGKALEVSDTEFLEEAIEKVPKFADGYNLLAKAYLAWDEPATALETLLDGQKQLPNDLGIIEMLARVLWLVGDHPLAFEHLRKALDKFPAQASLLALMGRFLFDEGQDEEARAYLMKAEVIEPRNPVLNEVRIYIARNMNN